MAESQFDKDFGYLMPFLDKVAEAARGLSNPAGRAELTALMAEEKQRWTRIQQLLSGAGSEGSPGADRTAPVERSRLDASSKEIPAFTVGSLRLPKR